MAARAVLFDFGGTLFSYGPFRSHFDRLIEEMARAHGIQSHAGELRQAFGAAMLRTLGAYTSRPFYLHRDLFAEAFETFLRSLGAIPPPGEGERFYASQNVLAPGVVAPREDARSTLAALRARGIHVGIVSNIDVDQFEPLWERMDLADVVDAVTTSEEARSCKPDPAIYRLALARAGDVAPEDAFFVGDSVVHDVAGANALGMRSVLLAKQRPAITGSAAPIHVIAELRALLELV